jgi:sulfate adenylyltransferase
MAEPQDLPELLEYANSLPGIQISKRSACDLQLLASGAFSPLDRFVGSNDYRHILGEMRLASGHVFPIPITLPVKPAAGLTLDREVTLRSERNEPLAILKIEEIYPWNREREAEEVFGTTDPRHPLVAEMQSWEPLYVSGSLRVLQSQRYFDFQDLRLTPSSVREKLQRLGRSNVVAFQTRSPLHRAHEEMTKRAIDATNGVLLLHPVVGLTKPGDIDHYTRVRTYKVMAERYYDPQRILLALIPLAMRLAGPKEALWHALIRRNYGANHLIVGRDHASPGHDSSGRPFYEPYAARDLVEQFSQEFGVKVIHFDEMVYWPAAGRYEAESSYSANEKPLVLSGTKLREEYLDLGRPLPEWFARPEVAQLLSETHPPRDRQGICIWFTGLSGAGKSTTAEILTELLLEHGRRATLLDGDIVRTQLSQGLGFSKEDRDTNIRRIGFVASEVVRHGGIAVCAAVSPYRATRDDVRSAMGTGRFLEVYVNTPLEICELRDAKGIYSRARNGEMKNVTGIDDPYEEPLNPEVLLDTVTHTAEENARAILHRLAALGFVIAEAAASISATPKADVSSQS